MVVVGVKKREEYASMEIVKIQEDKFVHVQEVLNAFRKNVTKFAIGEQNAQEDISAALECVLKS